MELYTPEELQEIRTGSQIFQLPNPLPGREIVPPNLIKAQYFRSQILLYFWFYFPNFQI